MKKEVKLIKKDEIEAVAIEWRKLKNKVDKYTHLMNKNADELKKYSKAYANIFVENQCKVTDSTFSRLDEKNITKFDGNFMDWEFVEDTVIWTGKGPRKYENQRYLKAKNDFNRLPSAPSNIWNKS